MKMNLSSTIVLNKIPEQFYRPRTAVDRSEITRCEKITTEIFPKVEEGAKLIANTIEAEIKAAQTAGRECVLGLGTGQSLTPVFEELIRRHEEGLSFANVVVFNAYEYFPLKVGSKNSSLHKLHELFLDKVDIKACNIFSPDGTIGQDNVQAHCAWHRTHGQHRDQRAWQHHHEHIAHHPYRCHLSRGDDHELRLTGACAAMHADHGCGHYPQS